MFPERGRNVPFTIENYAYRDPLGRETVSWVRTFETTKRRRFDAYMVWGEQRGRIVDYLGTHQHLAVDLDVSVAENGGLRLRSGEQRFYEGAVGFRFPMFFSGVAEVCEWYDDEAKCFRIRVDVKNKRWGPLFGYTGSFHEVEGGWQRRSTRRDSAEAGGRTGVTEEAAPQVALGHVSASCLSLTYHLDEHRTSVLRGSDLVEEIDASTLNPISRLQP